MFGVLFLGLGFWLCVAGAALLDPHSAAVDSLGLMSSVTPISTVLRRPRGRPRKFAVPSRAVTLTLPESVISALAAVNMDLSRAVVALTKRKRSRDQNEPAQLMVFGTRAVITVRPTATLERRAGVNLVPLPDGRALIAFDQAKTIAELELVLGDALDDETLPPEDRRVFEGIVNILRDARRSTDVAVRQRSIVVLESGDAASATPGRIRQRRT
jgi:hypothetical protein